MGPYQYEGDSLRFFPHAEGRVLRFVSALSGQVRYEREYTLKDHLGNLYPTAPATAPPTWVPWSRTTPPAGGKCVTHWLIMT